MRLIGYSEYRGKIYVIARPENAPKDSTAVFRLFYRRKVLCFKLVRRKRLCEAVFDKYARGFKKVSVKKAGSGKQQNGQ